jgi:hypothetical protein
VAVGYDNWDKALHGVQVEPGAVIPMPTRLSDEADLNWAWDVSLSFWGRPGLWYRRRGLSLRVCRRLRLRV